ncbi:MAG: hypothetical protein EBZ29_12330, partial [Synechococcaceae bacterium WB9_4xC_028]|nr:hypothetical protein [Synechococcaceae bacterium WB9_4xC_028]
MLQTACSTRHPDYWPDHRSQRCRQHGSPWPPPRWEPPRNQATPWLQGTFRYTGFDEFFHWDRNYEFKARLWEEELYLPQVAVGIRDMVGTGVFGSEYLVAS